MDDLQRLAHGLLHQKAEGIEAVATKLIGNAADQGRLRLGRAVSNPLMAGHLHVQQNEGNISQEYRG